MERILVFHRASNVSDVKQLGPDYGILNTCTIVRVLEPEAEATEEAEPAVLHSSLSRSKEGCDQLQ